MTMKTKKKIIAGNWKMNGNAVENTTLLSYILAGLPVSQSKACDVVVCVPFVYLSKTMDFLRTAAENSGSIPADIKIAVGAQDVSEHPNGAYTGEISATMLKEIGVQYAIVGHSERRQYHAETDEMTAQKTHAVLASGIKPIVCVGETLAEREAGQTENVVKRQLAAVIHANGHCISEIIVAYEPVWAIGTGKTASPEEAQAVHAILRAQLRAATPHADAVAILYGGSMNASNASALLSQPDIDGGLVGGASLKAIDFLSIVASAV